MTTPVRILIADDEPSMRSFIIAALADDGYTIAEFDPETSDATLLHKRYDVAIIDVMMPGLDGFQVHAEISKHTHGTQFIFITGFADKEKLDRAIGLGVYMFLLKPFKTDHIRYAVLGALRMNELSRKNLEYQVADDTKTMGLVGQSDAMNAVRRKITDAAPGDISVLVTGDSGTGKEVVAGCIHQCSRRAAQLFIAVNTASLSPTLIESELFGHAQGAFTGASKTKHGFFEIANGGTLFLDEIGDLSLELQSKLLRVLDKGEFCRVGETEPRRTDVRIISATNRDLPAMIKEARFRKDLYYRLRGTEIHLPPLRERADDIPCLLHHFIDDNGMVIMPDAMEIAQRFEWPGNIRELKAAANTLRGLCSNRIITKSMMERALNLDSAAALKMRKFQLFSEVKAETELAYFKSILEFTNSNISKAAAISGLDRKNLRNKLRALGLYNKEE
ncbi:MAG: sigma-54 dependent transcriptional regulator [Chitinispirillaceae bacterium]|jgi:DNA-binding NtrC family response regulator|nr:sigma-54 dependent transcriptional regulator [Chitinispirillaceae bacterium]